MNIITSSLLGLVQGITEFLPISSSGHLIVMRDILGLDVTDSLSFDAILQLATALAIIVYFYKDIIVLVTSVLRIIARKHVEERDRKLVFALIIGTIPAIIFGVLLEQYMDTIFRNAHLVAYVLIFGSIVFYFAEKYAKQNSELTVKKGFLIGLFQCFALVPGFSRSGVTISGGLFLGLNREASARFSFLLSIPIILGSGLKKLFDLYNTEALGNMGIDLLVGSIVAFLVGLLVIHFLLKYLKTHTLNIFGIYRILLAILIIFFV